MDFWESSVSVRSPVMSLRGLVTVMRCFAMVEWRKMWHNGDNMGEMV